MTSISKYACAFVLAGGLASPALAAQGDAGSGPTTGATSTNDAGSGPTKGIAVNSESPAQHGQSETNASPAAVNAGARRKMARPTRTQIRLRQIVEPKSKRARPKRTRTGGDGQRKHAHSAEAACGPCQGRIYRYQHQALIVLHSSQEFGGQPSDHDDQSGFRNSAHRGDATLRFRQQFPAYGRKRQQRRSDAWTEFDRGCATCHARRRARIRKHCLAAEAAKPIQARLAMGLFHVIRSLRVARFSKSTFSAIICRRPTLRRGFESLMT